ncbi:MAG: SH3 domain-containing protein [Anaerotignum sp.]|nr:SH3 domain-containing protein [Anaerotignum sp.]
MKLKRRIRIGSFLLAMVLSVSTLQPAYAAVTYMPDVTAEMSDASFWAEYHDGYSDVILTQEEIKAFNQDTFLADGTMVMDLKTAAPIYNGVSRNASLISSSTADAQYYLSWTYDKDGNKTDWAYFQEMIDNTQDPAAKEVMQTRYAIAVNRTVVQVFPSDKFLLDDPYDKDSDNMALSAVPVNEPLIIYNTSADGKYYQARIASCSGWIPAEDVAICADKEEWLSAWDLPSENLLVVYGNKVYTDKSYETVNTSKRMLTMGAAVELVTDLVPDQRVGNRSPYHNYVVYLPVRNEDGSYGKELALIPETAKVSNGYLPLTMENIAMVSMNMLGDAYGWGGMLDVEDCSGMVRTVYSCFGLEVARNGNWQWNMNMEKIDMTNMSLEEKCTILDEMPMGSALCFPGHEMIYLGKVDGKYYVISAVGTIMSPDTGKRLNTREVMINTMDVKRANGKTWLQAIDKAFMPCYGKLEGKVYDFPDTQWYHEAVGYCLKNGILTNKTDGTFGVNDVVTRAMVADALYAAEKKPTTMTHCFFGDVGEAHPSRKAITWVAENGIMAGYGDITFGASDAVTREQLVAILFRYAQYKGLDVSVGEETNILSYNDAFDISEYAIPAMQWVCGAGILNGDDAGNLNPDGTAQKVHLAQLLMKLQKMGS